MNLNNIFLTLFILYSHAVKAQVNNAYIFKNISKTSIEKVVEKEPHLLSHSANADSLDKILNAFYATEEYENIFINKELGKVVIEGIPLKSIAQLKITGNKTLSTSTIKSSIILKEGGKFYFQNLLDSIDTIKETYTKMGYYNVEVTSSQETSLNKVNIIFEIKEGAPCIISDVQFVTDFEDLSEQLKTKLKKIKNKTLNQEVIFNIEDQIKNHLSDSKILNSTITGPVITFNDKKTQAQLAYSINNSQKFSIFFEGNKYLSSTELTDKLEIKEKVAFGSNPGAEMSAKLEKVYKSYGFAHVHIKQKEIISNRSSIRKMYFDISEGPRVFIKEIKFNGTLSKPQDYYVDLFEEKYDSNLYKQEQLSETLDKIIRNLQDVGYLQAKILSTQTIFSDNKAQVKIQFYLDEGPRTQVQNIYFKGIKAFSSAQLKEVIQLRELEPLNLTKLENANALLTDFLQSKGYLDAEVKTKFTDIIKYSNDNTKADLFFDIYEGPLVAVNRIVIEGNTLTRNHVILNQIEFDEGDNLTPQKIFDSEYHLQKTGLFNAVEILTLEKGTQISNRTVLIKVQERNPGLVNFGVGVNTEFDFTVRGYAGVSYNNIAGTARAVSGRVEVKRVADIDFIDHNVVLSYLEPTLWAKRTRGRVALIRAREIITRSPDVKVLESNTANFFIEKDFTRNLKLTWNFWSISTNKIFLLSNNQVEEDVDIATIGPTIEWDKRDHPFVTRKGYFLKLSGEYSHDDFGSSSTVHFTRYESRFNLYRPIKFLDTIWANSIRAGYLYNTENQSNSFVPDVKEFKLGGRDTLRGFEPNEIPRDSDVAGETVTVNTDSYFYLINTEFRVPLYGNVETVLFYDGGSVKVSGHKFNDEYRESAGIGIRYKTPVGPLSVEYGHKLDRNKDLDESPGRFHLSFGTF